MSNIEGMWLMRSTQVDSVDEVFAPSIIILETERLFGGDSYFYYLGEYSVNDGLGVGRVRVQTHTILPEMENVFGMPGPVDYEVDFEVAIVADDHLQGVMRPVEGDYPTLKVDLQKLSELP